MLEYERLKARNKCRLPVLLLSSADRRGPMFLSLVLALLYCHSLLIVVKWILIRALCLPRTNLNLLLKLSYRHLPQNCLKVFLSLNFLHPLHLVMITNASTTMISVGLHRIYRHNCERLFWMNHLAAQVVISPVCSLDTLN